MSGLRETFWQQLQPIWRDRELFTRAGASVRIAVQEHTAVRLGADEAAPPFNFCAARLGSQRNLHDIGQVVFDQIRADCDFGSWDCWDDQRVWFVELIRQFFPEHEESIGVCSVLAARRPAWCRTQQDPTIAISQGVARPHFLHSVRKIPGRRLTLGDKQLPMRGLRLAGMSEHVFRKAKLTMTVVPRRVVSSRFQIDSRYEEFWVTLANPADHREALQQGKLPVAGESFYQWGHGRIRCSPLVNLIGISRSLMYSVLAIELHPVSAEVLSLRWSRYPLSVAMVQASPVEHYAIQQALTQLQ